MKWLGGLIFNGRRHQLSGWRRPPLPLSPEVVMIGKTEDGNDAHSGVIQVFDRGVIGGPENKSVIAKENVVEI